MILWQSGSGVHGQQALGRSLQSFDGTRGFSGGRRWKRPTPALPGPPLGYCVNTRENQQELWTKNTFLIVPRQMLWLASLFHGGKTYRGPERENGQSFRKIRQLLGRKTLVTFRDTTGEGGGGEGGGTQSRSKEEDDYKASLHINFLRMTFQENSFMKWALTPTDVSTLFLSLSLYVCGYISYIRLHLTYQSLVTHILLLKIVRRLRFLVSIHVSGGSPPGSWAQETLGWTVYKDWEIYFHWIKVWVAPLTNSNQHVTKL